MSRLCSASLEPGQDPLGPYKARRDFAQTPEPREGGRSVADGLSFVVQKHWATRVHDDLRLELDGTMKRWAVPKGPSFDPTVKRMAVQVEDHPLAYADFEGTVPQGSTAPTRSSSGTQRRGLRCRPRQGVRDGEEGGWGARRSN